MNFPSKVQAQANHLMGTPKLIRYVEWYEKTGDQPIGETILQEVPLSELQALFGESSETPMYDCYRISADHVNYLQPKLEHSIALEQYDYYLSCYKE
jgi:hypothetical protein